MPVLHPIAGDDIRKGVPERPQQGGPTPGPSPYSANPGERDEQAERMPAQRMTEWVGTRYTIGVVAHEGSTLVVVANGLRLLTARRTI